MTESSPVRKKMHWVVKALILSSALFALLLVVLFFAINSAGFWNGWILPKASQTLHSKLTLNSMSVKPWKSIEIQDFTLTPDSKPTLLQAKRASVHFSPFSLLGSSPVIREITLLEPHLTLIQEPDGTFNYSPILKGLIQSDSSASPSNSTSSSLKPSIEKCVIQKGHIRFEKRSSENPTQVSELSGLDLVILNLTPGGSPTITLYADGLVDSPDAPASGAASLQNLLAATLNAKLNLTLSDAWIPETLDGSGSLKITRATGNFSNLNQLNGTFVSKLSATRLENCQVSFERNQTVLGSIQLSGPMEMSRLEGDIDFVAEGISSEVLDLVGAPLGFRFGKTQVAGQGKLVLSQNGTLFSTKGNLNAKNFSLQSAQGITPVLDISTLFNLTRNLRESSLLINEFSLQALQGARTLVSASVDRPMNLHWGSGQPGFRESSLKVQVSQADLSQWKFLLGPDLPTGLATADVSLLAKNDGKVLEATFNTQLDRIQGKLSGIALNDFNLKLSGNGSFNDYRILLLPNFKINLQQGTQPVLSATGSANYRRDNQDAGFQTTSEISLATATALFPIEGIEASQGLLKLNGTFSQTQQSTNLSFNARLSDYTGKLNQFEFKQFQIESDFQLNLQESTLKVQKGMVSLQEGFKAGGSLDLTGTYHLARNTGSFQFSGVNLNEVGLRPFLTPFLKDKSLQTASITLNGKGDFDPSGTSRLDSNVEIKNLVVKDPSGSLPSQPLAISLGTQSQWNKENLTLDSFKLQLSPTSRAANQLQMQGKWFWDPKVASGNLLTLRSDSLDITPFYDLFAPASDPSKPASTPAPPTPTTPGTEPEAIQLPFQNLDGSLNLARFYLREIAATNVVATLKVTQGRNVSLNPLSLQVNGGNVNGSLVADLGVPGFQYNTDLKLEQIPAAPLMNSLTSVKKDSFQGILNGGLKIDGKGTTGVNLAQFLKGDVQLSVTNANVQLVSPLIRTLFMPVATLLRMPDIFDSPLNALNARIGIEKGAFQIQEAMVESPAFHATTTGSIPIAQRLELSKLNLPVDLKLRRSLARKSNLLGAGEERGSEFVPLPQFITLGGTFDKMEVKTDKLAIASLLGKSIIDLPVVTMDRTVGTAVDTVTGILKDGLFKSSNESTNQVSPGTSTNKPPSDAGAGLIRGLGGILGGLTKPNAATEEKKTETTPSTPANEPK